MNDIALLEQKANEIRKLIFRQLSHSKSGHPGGSLSCADLHAALYFDVMNIDPQNPTWADRDRFVLSKGHACPTLYAVLAMKGYFDMEELDTLRDFGSILQGHPYAGKTPGVDFSTGSLGQGLSAANGIALAAKLDEKDYYVYCLMGDGEIEEGQIWEAAMTSAHYNLDNVIGFVDYNHLQIDGTIEDVIGNGNIEGKFRAFGWHTITIDGHNIAEILSAIETAKNTKGIPTMIIMNTVKGKGVSYMENDGGWHGKTPSDEQIQLAVKELEGNDK